MGASLLAASLVDLAVAGLFAYVGRRVTARHVSSGSEGANAAWATWWFAIAVLWGMDAARGLAAAVGAAGPLGDVFLFLHYAYVGILCVALWALLSYLVFLFRGVDARVPLAAAYGAYFVVASAAIAYAGPDSVRVGDWATSIEYARDLPRLAEVGLLVFLLLPQVVGAAAYLSLARRTRDDATKRRILLVGSALVAWIGVSLAADLASLGGEAAWEIARRGLAVAASVTILVAYRGARV